MLTIDSGVQVIKNKGNIVYEYNPLYNYRLSGRSVPSKDSEGHYLDRNRNILYYTTSNIEEDDQLNISKYAELVNQYPAPEKSGWNLYAKTSDGKFYKSYYFIEDDGVLQDLITGGEDEDVLNFDLFHPVDIECQQSYDGSVNLILNDGKNIPRLINTRFTLRENNTYERVDRKGNTDTNIYDYQEFETDTSLFKRYNKIPKIDFIGVHYGGSLKVGNYFFYFKLADGDGNETDFVGQSNLVSIYIGALNAPSSIRGGQLDENANKAVSFSLTNIDSSYDYVNIYYTRSTGLGDQIANTTAHKIERTYRIKNGICTLTISGNETVTDIPLSELNIEHFIAASARTQAISQNMLFLGNVTKPNIDYVELQKLSCKFFPFYVQTDSKSLIGSLDYNYQDYTNKFQYYNPDNIYNRVGYWPEEIYRFGIVYIMNDNSLTPVFNIRGRELTKLNNTINTSLEDFTQGDLTIDYDNLMINKSTLENAAGVVKFPSIISDSNSSIISDSNLPIFNLIILAKRDTVLTLKKDFGIKGYFIVRQKRIPTILCQAFGLGVEEFSGIPLLHEGPYYLAESFLKSNGELTENFNDRLVEFEQRAQHTLSAICPEYELNQLYYNSIFTGGQFDIKKVASTTLVSKDRHFFTTWPDSLTLEDTSNIDSANIISVPDSAPAIRNNEFTFRAKAGDPEDIKFKYLVNDTATPIKKNFSNQGTRRKHVELVTGGLNSSGAISSAGVYYNSITNQDRKVKIVRGAYGTYLGLTKVNTINPGDIFNIYIPGYTKSTIDSKFDIRIQDDSPYYQIGQRYEFSEKESNKYCYVDPKLNITLENNSGDLIQSVFGGDCYICNFTHRLNRNFQDPDAPNNDVIVDKLTWRDNWNEDKKEGSEVNRGDINAIPLGAWVTFQCYSTMNLGLRDWDGNYPMEETLTGNKRSFYPLQAMSTSGNTKIPESVIYNQGFSKNVGEKFNFLLPNVPYLKNNFQTRVMYSLPAAAESFKNGFREFSSVAYRDYPNQYGGLVKLISWGQGLIAVFEHAIAFIPVNQRALIPTDDGTEIAVGAVKVIPEALTVISDTYGSQWAESICESEAYIYGIDTIAKKIWRTNGRNIELISDMKVQKFLNENITLTERELQPIIGIRNVKTHYNAYKHDIMFTFYDNTYGFEECVWNLCYNELMSCFVTFYSWVPSYSANIDNIFFTFNRDTSKWISKLAASKSNRIEVQGICVDEPNISKWISRPSKEDPEIKDDYEISPLADFESTPIKFGAKLSLENKPYPKDATLTITYTLEKDNFGFYKYFTISGDTLDCTDKTGLKTFMQDRDPQYSVVQLNIKADIKVTYESTAGQNGDPNSWEKFFSANAGYYETQVFLTFDEVLEPLTEGWNTLRTDFWKHGQAGIIDVQELIKPCHWYGKQHPFEFEYIVGNSTAGYKQFTNMQLITNKVQPESFHYTIIGDSYDFVDTKPTLYFRQEATKAFYQWHGADLLYNHDTFKDKYFHIFGYKDGENSIVRRLTSSNWIQKDSNDTYLRNSSAVSNTYKGTYFPLIYYKQDTFNEIEHYYKKANAYLSQGMCYTNATGTELVWDKQLNEFRICNHVQARNIKNYGRAKGNLEYVNDRWNVQISPISLLQKNEAPWQFAPKLVINNSPKSLYGVTIEGEKDFPKELSKWYKSANDLDYWDNVMSSRKEMKLMDTYCKVKVRYSGEQLAIILATNTQFNTFA